MLSNRVYPVCRLTVANRSPPWFCRASKGVFRTGFPSAHICIRAVGVPVLGRNPARYIWFSGASNPFEVLLKRARNRAIVHRRIAAGQDREKTAAIGGQLQTRESVAGTSEQTHRRRVFRRRPGDSVGLWDKNRNIDLLNPKNTGCGHAGDQVQKY